MRNGEVVQRVVKRHLTPYFFRIFQLVLFSAPAYLLLFYLGHYSAEIWFLWVAAIVSFFVGVAAAVISIDYLLDKLVITNKRVILIDWKSLLRREESEVDLNDIQDIETIEHGVFSDFKIFDYGYFAIETSASKTSITFKQCPDPEELKHFVWGQVKG